MQERSRPVVCQLLHSLVVGGAEVLAAELARRLSDKYRFVFACLDELGPIGEQLRGEGFTVEVFRRRPGIDLKCMKRLWQWWRQQRVELVHAHQYTPFFYAAAARAWRAWPPILFTEHGRFFPDYPRRKRMLFNRVMLRRGDRVVAVGQAVRSALVRNEGIPQRRIEVIYNGIDVAAFASRPADAAEVRCELGLDGGDVVVIQVARLDYLKDHPTALRAIHQASSQCDRVRLLVVGDGPERPRIETEIARLGIANHVRMLGLRQDVLRLLWASDIFLLSSISEGIPVTIIEAMAAGLPVVATTVGGVPELVLDGQTGLLAPAGDYQRLGDSIVRLAQAPQLRAEMGSAGRRRACEMFSQEKMHGAYLSCYEEMLGNGKLGR